MATLQNPVKGRLEALTNDLKNVTKAQKNYGKALDRVSRLSRGKHWQMTLDLS